MKMKKRKNQDEDKEKKCKNINREERDKEMRDFFFFEIYKLYFSLFQDNYFVLLIRLSSINFDFSIFQE